MMKTLVAASLLLAGLAGLVPTASAAKVCVGALVCAGSFDQGDGSCQSTGERERFIGVATPSALVGLRSSCYNYGGYHYQEDGVVVAVVIVKTFSDNGQCYVHTMTASVPVKDKVCNTVALLPP